MFRVSPPGRRIVGVPVVVIEGPCSACHAAGGEMVRKLDITVCADEQACRDRIVLAVLDGEL